MILINIRNLSKIYHTEKSEVLALDNISMDIHENKIISIVGSSGCGKSTLLNLITNSIKPSTGFIRNNKKLIIGYMMQVDALFPWLTNYENAILGLKLKNMLTKESENYVNDLLKKYDLYSFKDEYPSSLSGGMRQRLSLIRTLAIKPNILLLDEPFSKLDNKTKLSIRDDVYKIIKELNITTILITHEISEAVSLSDDVIVLSKRPGRIINKYRIINDYLLPSDKLKINSINKIINRISKDIDYV